MTHPDIIRYFMTIPEASRLVLQAAAIGESGQVLVLDMGEPVRIADLARELIRLAGYSSDEIAIEFTGLRAGEKLFEELLADGDVMLATTVTQVCVARLASLVEGHDLLRHLLILAQRQEVTPSETRTVLQIVAGTHTKVSTKNTTSEESGSGTAAREALRSAWPHYGR